MIKGFSFNLLLRVLELPLKVRARIRKRVLFNSFQIVGSNVILDPLTSVFPSDGKTQIGNNVFIGKNAYFGGEISVGNNVMFGPNVTLVAGNHIFAIRGKSPRFIRPLSRQSSEAIVIEDEVWIGANVVVLGGVTVGIGSVVGAGSVVVSDICPFTISVGNPSRPVRRIFNNGTLRLHLRGIGYSDAFAAEIIAKREKLLKDIDIPLVDNTEIYKQIIYDA